MKKTVAGLAFIMALLFSAIAGTKLVNCVRADPMGIFSFPNSPIKTPPEMIFQSPINNQTYASNSVWLNFTIVKPESWFRNTSALPFIFVNVTSVNYTIDGATSKSIPVHDLDSLYWDTFNRSLDFSTDGLLKEGAHDLVVSVQCDSYYWVSYYYPVSNIQVNFTSEVVHFNIAMTEPFPTTLVVAPVISVVTIGIGLLFYFKKRKR